MVLGKFAVASVKEVVKSRKAKGMYEEISSKLSQLNNNEIRKHIESYGTDVAEYVSFWKPNYMNQRVIDIAKEIHEDATITHMNKIATTNQIYLKNLLRNSTDEEVSLCKSSPKAQQVLRRLATEEWNKRKNK